MPDRVSLRKAAAIIGQTSEALAQWRFRKGLGLRALGTAQGREVLFDEGEVALLGLVSAFARGNRSLPECVGLATGLNETLQQMLAGELGRKGPVYALHVEGARGRAERVVCEGPEELAKAVQALAEDGCVRFSALDLSNLLAELRLAFDIVAHGPDDARDRFAAAIAALPPEQRGAAAAWFVEVERRLMGEPAPADAPRHRAARKERV